MKYIFCILVLFLFGCMSYGGKTAKKCRAECETKQKNNIGANFLWKDFDRTFGKCTCVSLNGTTEEFYIKAVE